MKKRRISQLLSVLLTAAMLLTFLPAAAFAAEDLRTKVSVVEATATGLDIFKYGAPASDEVGRPLATPEFRVQVGNPAYFTMIYCQKWNGEYWDSYRMPTFTEGRYRYSLQVRIDEDAGRTHVLGQDLTVRVNGAVWNHDPVDVWPDASMASLKSPEYIIEAPAEMPLTVKAEASIPHTFTGNAIDPVDLKTCVEGGKEPYTFVKQSGPSWLSVSEQGIVTGTPGSAHTGSQRNLLVTVTDSAQSTVQLTVPVSFVDLPEAEKIRITAVEVTVPGLDVFHYGAPACSEIGRLLEGPETAEVTVGSPAYFNIGMLYCSKLTNGEWKPYTLPVFTEGQYMLDAPIRLEDEGAINYTLADGCTVKVNGEEWTPLSKLFNGVGYAQGFTYSPVYTIEAPPEQPLSVVKQPSLDTSLSGQAIPETNIADCIAGGKAPLSFAKQSGPAWLAVSADGTVTGTPEKAHYGEQENLVITVTDSKNNSIQLTVSVGKVILTNEDKDTVSAVAGTAENLDIFRYGAKACDSSGEPLEKPVFTRTSGAPADFCRDAMRCDKWDGSSWVTYKEPIFTEGKYRYAIQVRIEKPDSETTRLADGCTVTVNGTAWTPLQDPYSVPAVSFDWTYSPEYIIEKPEVLPIGVTRGTASVTEAAPGTRVEITADPAPADYVFDRWIVESGSVTLEDANAAVTSFTMPDCAVLLKATYKRKVSLHTGVLVEGRPAAPGVYGWKDYYRCSHCGQNYTDAECTDLIVNLAAWKEREGRIEMLPCEFTEGADAEWVKYSGRDLLFKANGRLGDLSGIAVDQNSIGSNFYAAQSDPAGTAFTLKSNYLQTLPAGSHTLTLVFQAGRCSAAFTVVLPETSIRWEKQADGWHCFNEADEPFKGVNYLADYNEFYIFDENGVLQQGDENGDQPFGGNLYFINPLKNDEDPTSFFFVRDYARVRPGVGVTYYNNEGITYVGWVTSGDKKLYQTKVNVDGEDLYIYVWRAQYIPEWTNPVTGDVTPAGLYLFGDDGVLAGEGAYRNESWPEGDLKYYVLADGTAATGVRYIDGEFCIFGDDGRILTGDENGDQLYNGNLYYYPEGQLYFARNYARVRPGVGVTYYNNEGITYVGWVTSTDAEGNPIRLYQTKVNVDGKDLYIYVWRAQHIPEWTNPVTGDVTPEGFYLFGDDGVLITEDGTYECGDGNTYEVKDGVIVG